MLSFLKKIAITASVILLCLSTYNQGQSAIVEEPSMWWKFDKTVDNKTIEEMSGIQDSIYGYFKTVGGVSGNCLKYDGYTTRVIRKVSELNTLSDEITFDAWVALQSLPWNWCGIVVQGGDEIHSENAELPVLNLDKLNLGLIGVQFGNPSLTNALGKQELLTTENDWTGSMNDWSNRWRGYIEAPFSGEINFRAEADDGLQLIIDDKIVIDGWQLGGLRTGKFSMEKGKKYPVLLNYYNDGGQAILRLFWKWNGQGEQLIPIKAFGYSQRDNLLARQDIIPPPPPEPQYAPKIFLGIDAFGHLGFKLNLDGKLYECVSQQKLSLLKWNHVAATYDQKNGMKIFINGELVGNLKINGRITPAGGSDLLIGMNIQKLGPLGSERKASENIDSKMVLDGLIDEVKIYNKSLSNSEIEYLYRTSKPEIEQPLDWAKLPAGPEFLTKEFDAIYTRLNYTPEWDNSWRVTDYPDILIHFDKLPIRYIFWRGTSYGGAWITENKIWMADQSLERANEGKSAMGCSEHMSDKQTRYSSVRIIEKNDARIIIQWRYAVTDIMYDIFGTNTGSGWGEWADEYYCIYPDGVATRHQILWTNFLSHEWQETIVINQAGTYPENNIELDAMTLANMDGEFKTYSWKEGPPLSFSEPENINIQMVNLQSEYKPFIIFEPGPKIKPFKGSIRAEYSHFPWWNHWPVAQLPNDGRKAFGPDRPSHTSLSQSIEDSEVIHKRDSGSYEVVTLTGMTDKAIPSLANLARSWNNSAEITTTSAGYTIFGYDKNERAYIITKGSSGGITKGSSGGESGLEILLKGSDESPVINPAFVIKCWGNEEIEIEIEIDGIQIPRGDSFRYGFRTTMEGNDLVVWIKVDSKNLMNINFIPVH